TYFTGVENARAIFSAGVTQMPGVETPDAMIKATRTPQQNVFAERGFNTSYATFYFCNVDDLMRVYDGKGWDAAWLDYTGPMTVERLAIIRRFYHTHIRRVLIVTALNGRFDRGAMDAMMSAGGYSEWLRRNLEGDVLHDLEYFDTSPMIQLAIR